MFKKPTHFLFSKYDEIVSDLAKRQDKKLTTNTLKLKDKSFNQFMSYPCDVYINVISGIVMLVLSNDESAKTYERFVLHRHIRINANVKFNFLCISNNARVELQLEKKVKKVICDTYQKETISYEPITPSFEIKEILGTYHQVRNANTYLPEENHPFWELIFIDYGDLFSNVDGDSYHLEDMDYLLYEPGQNHDQRTNDIHACSYLTILFDMSIPDSFLITNRVYHAHRDIYQAFSSFTKAAQNESLYSDELMLCYLKEILVMTLQYDFMTISPVASSPQQQHFENELLNEVVLYIQDMLYESLSVDQICNQFSISRSSLQTLFKNNLGCSPKQYILDAKLNKSKLLIKENMYTISEVSSMLGFNSIHYFSRLFKQRFGVTPSEYAKTMYN